MYRLITAFTSADRMSHGMHRTLRDSPVNGLLSALNLSRPLDNIRRSLRRRMEWISVSALAFEQGKNTDDLLLQRFHCDGQRAEEGVVGQSHSHPLLRVCLLVDHLHLIFGVDEDQRLHHFSRHVAELLTHFQLIY